MRGDPRSQTVITSASIPLSDETASDDAPTAQGGDPDDRRITGAIRDALHADESLSPAARNTRVVTQNRRVVLRGTVADERERQTVESIARGQAVDVDDEITVAK
jgi:osmotically-inducible protein OsmY